MKPDANQPARDVADAAPAPGWPDIPAPPSATTFAIVILGFTAFVLGTAEFVIVGVLDLVAKELEVSIGAAGQLVMAYALGISLGGPVITALTMTLERRALLVATVGFFVVANLVMSLSSQFSLLMIARFTCGSMHGLFVGVASVLAAGLVAKDRRGRAMSMVFGGVAVATVVGVPLGTLVAQSMGWRIAFGAIATLALLACTAMWWKLPHAKQRHALGFATQTRAALAPCVLAMLAIGMLLMGGQFTAFTYLTPYLKSATAASGPLISAFLLAYGVASAAGMFAGGRLADRAAGTTLIVANATLIVVLIALYLSGRNQLLTAVMLGAWGLVGFGLIPSLQLRIVTLAGRGGDLAATLSASAVNLGIAIGSVIGARVLYHYEVRSIVIVAAAICSLALPFTIVSRRFREGASEPSQPDRTLERSAG